MNQEIKNRIKKKVPQFVFDYFYSDQIYDVTEKIVDNYTKDDYKELGKIKDIASLLILKDIAIENLFSSLKEKLNFDDKITKEITLIIFTEILYPIKDYFPGIEDEILKLGGEVPKEKPKRLTEQLLKREELEEEKERERMADIIINDTIENLIKKYPIVGEQQIGSQKSINIKSMPVPMKPLIKYWLKDYKEKMGYYQHSNLERVQYVYHDKNTKNMNEEERRQLNLILKSVDEGISLPYSTRLKKIDFSKTGE
jgi:hypothetical protein